jgi:(p)ppGpp synthase/HD superfamily hydrolase
LMVTLSDERWHQTAKNEAKYMENKITAALLHDFIEDNYPSDQREQAVADIKAGYGRSVAEDVEFITAPSEDMIQSEQARRMFYAIQLYNSRSALELKSSDRMQNHITDLVRLAGWMVTLQTNEHADEQWKIRDYFAKTEEYLFDYFTTLPDVYTKVLETVWALKDRLNISTGR